ncbi:S6 family peptidase [Haemophilus haemolyticus]|uniref:S6 family peptidase n=1 Tax=Haemophilus haemolyticus TaxID=726 RepID=UPI000E57CC85|nr:S6 family peptidase [Haemophilus haemolyticus]
MKKTIFRFNFLTVCISLGIVSQVWAGHTYFGINYQYYRDFAENKGKFTVGAQNIDIYNKKGEMIGTMMKGVPMPDLSSLAKGGYATLVGDQHLVSVAHNVGYQDVDFGEFGRNPDRHNYKYLVVKRYNYVNDARHPFMTDYQHPRLAKFVTEVAPIEMVTNTHGNVYTDLKKYPMRVRAGSGHQYWKNDNNETNGDLAYGGTWLTGGNTFMDGGTRNGDLYLNGRVQNPNEYGPLPIAGAQGDSGSPMFIYDKDKGKWLLNGVLREGNPYAAVGNGYQVARQEYLEEVQNNDTTVREFANNAHYVFKTVEDGKGTISQNGRKPKEVGLYKSTLLEKARDQNGDISPSYGGPNPWSPALHNGKTIYLGDMGKGILTIANNVNQGAGGIYFEGDFTVKPSENNITWQGAGVSIGEDATVEWQVKNPEGDRLSKLGIGTLLINGTGKNLGDISVGNGTVILDQKADTNGQKQAFKEVGIVSGRATVKLNSADQVDPNNIYFGFRGGRLDLNGNDLTFTRIQNVDEGAMLVNHNANKESNITITGSNIINNKENDLTNKRDIAFNGWFGDKDDAKNTGRLNVNYSPTNQENHLLLSGGTNLKGNITQNGGNLIFSGRPTPHAYNHLREDLSKREGIPRGEIVWDHDWINRTFIAENFNIQNGKAIVSRNVSSIKGGWDISNNASVTFGVIPNKENTICTRSDWTGATTCQSVNLTDPSVIKSIPTTQVNGHISLSDHARLNVNGLVSLNGSISAHSDSEYHLTHKANQAGDIHLEDNAQARINDATMTGDMIASDNTNISIANHSTTNGSIQITDNANLNIDSSTVNGNLQAIKDNELTVTNSAQVNGNVTLNKNATYTLKDQAVQVGNLSTLGNNRITLSNHARLNGLLDLATDSSIADITKSIINGNVRSTGRVNVNDASQINGSVNLSNIGKITIEHSQLTGNLTAQEYSTYHLSYQSTHQGNLILRDQADSIVDDANLIGDAQLTHSAQLKFNNARFEHKITGENTTHVTLNQSQWTMPTSTTLGSLTLNNGSAVTLNPDFSKETNRNQFNILTINGDLNGSGTFNYLTHLNQYLGDKLQINGLAQGTFKLNVRNTGAEPTSLKHLTLVSLKSMPSTGLDISLTNQYVDAGTWRYELVKDGNQYRLYSPIKEAELKQAEADRIEAEKRKAQEEQERIEAEKRKAQEEQERIEAEKRKAQEEQERIEAEKRKAQEEQARIEAKKQLKQKNLISKYSNNALSELSATVNSMLSVQDELDRLFVEQMQPMVWTNIAQDKRRYDSDAFRAYKQKTNLRQIGMQKALGNGRIGAVFSHSRSDNTFDEQVKNYTTLMMLSGFAQYQWKDFQFGVSVGMGSSVSKTAGEQSRKIYRKVVNYGVNASYQFRLGQLGIQPYLGGNRYFIERENYQSEGVRVQTPSLVFNRYNTGVRFDYTFTPTNNITIKPYFSVNYVDASNANMQIKVNSATLQQPFGRYWQKELGLSTEILHFQFSAAISQSKGSQLDKQQNIGLKLGYRW